MRLSPHHTSSYTQRPGGGLMLGQRLRRWTSFTPPLGQRVIYFSHISLCTAARHEFIRAGRKLRVITELSQRPTSFQSATATLSTLWTGLLSVSFLPLSRYRNYYSWPAYSLAIRLTRSLCRKMAFTYTIRSTMSKTLVHTTLWSQ